MISKLNRVYLNQTNQTHFEPNPSFFSKSEPNTNWNKNSIPHIPNCDGDCRCDL